MNSLSIQDTIVLNKSLRLPSNGMICAHPQRVKRIAREFLTHVRTHTDYRGYQLYVGFYQGEEVFVANTGIGAPAAAFLLEELVAFGAKRIIRVGSNDSSFREYGLTLVEETTLPLGLKQDYQLKHLHKVRVNDYLGFMINLRAKKLNFNISFAENQHIDGYYASYRERTGSSDMETGALYLLGQYYQLQYASILMSYPKHGAKGEYGGELKAREIEDQGITLALMSLI
jgi:purine-nucleoside phosphorylase